MEQKNFSVLFLKIFEQTLINWPTVAMRGEKEILTGIVSWNAHGNSMQDCLRSNVVPM